MFCDGAAQDLRLAKVEAEKLKKEGVEIITISVGGPGSMKNMASRSELSMDMKLTSLAYSAEYAEKIELLICGTD